MEIYDLLKYVVLPVVLCYIGFNERDKSVMKYKLDNSISKLDVEKLIDIKIAVHQVQIQDIKDDLVRIESKLDMLLERM